MRSAATLLLLLSPIAAMASACCCRHAWPSGTSTLPSPELPENQLENAKAPGIVRTTLLLLRLREVPNVAA